MAQQSYAPSAHWVYVPQPLSFVHEPPKIPLPLLGAGVYLSALVFIPFWVKRPVPSSLLTPIVAAHNLFLLLASIVMFLGTILEVFTRLSNGSSTFFDLYCDPKKINRTGLLMYWIFFFHVSKYYELLDTLWIILRKKPVDVLHKYHHAITLLVTWAGLEDGTTYQWMAVCTNTFVHIIMYYYYLRKTLNPSLRVWWKKYLTSLQMVQFLLNLSAIFGWAYFHRTVGCSGSWGTWVFVVYVNLSFYYLFNLFYKANYSAEKVEGAEKMD